MNARLVILCFVGFVTLIPNIYAEKITQNFEGGMDVEISYPDEIIVGREETISILIKNNGCEDKQDISI